MSLPRRRFFKFLVAAPVAVVMQPAKEIPKLRRFEAGQIITEDDLNQLVDAVAILGDEKT